MRFTYTSGSRPLDGFTLKRGVGRGGFGEVYFAVSDGGKEVALKLLHEEGGIELRGVELCLNLKHPHLVHLYDLRKDAQGEHWVVMEYIAGDSLATSIGRQPGGLPRDQVREWFLGLCRAVAYLHDHGVVHRDLKPANVFVENGIVKVGDYGLSKNLSGSQNAANTQSVGTVHYMAPEISTGNYTRQVDVYAAGVMLYEMLTGQVPFDGTSAGEILMKHLTTTPDLARVPDAWVPIVAKALAKDPAKRYATMSELAEAVAPAATSEPRLLRSDLTSLPLPDRRGSDSKLRTPNFRRQAAELCGSMLLAVLFAGLTLPLWGALGRLDPSGDADNRLTLSTVFFLTVAACWAVLVPAKFWTARRGDSWTRRLVMVGLGGLVGLTSLWLGPHWPDNGAAVADLDIGPPLFYGGHTWGEFGALTYFGLAFFVRRWWRLADRHRAHRFEIGPVLGAGFWALLLVWLIKPHLWTGAVAIVMTAAIVQLVSPWEEPPPAPARKPRVRIA